MIEAKHRPRVKQQIAGFTCAVLRLYSRRKLIAETKSVAIKYIHTHREADARGGGKICSRSIFIHRYHWDNKTQITYHLWILYRFWFRCLRGLIIIIRIISLRLSVRIM